MGKASQLRSLITRDELGFLMEAHNGLSAKIVEEAGFEAIWGSGLSMSAAMGVRDNNEATWTQVLEVLEFMADHTSIPILVDGDTGYGDFNTMRRVVRKLESRGVAGVCIEDKLFPKTNSFINGASQPLAPMDEFCGKLKAGNDARNDPDFVIVARVEAFIAGWGLAEALRRAEAYCEAGADAILIHSARRHPDEVFAFAREWQRRSPLILVPTKYYNTPTAAFRQHGIAAVIWANHLLRASIRAMQRTAKEIYSAQALTPVEDKIVTVSEVFRLQGADELAEAEQRYLPAPQDEAKALILAYARGEEMAELTVDRPKAMVHIGGQPILQHIAETFRSVGVKDLRVVRGYEKESVSLDGLTYYDASTEEKFDEVFALSSALECFSGALVVCYGDVLFRKFIVSELIDSKADFCVMIDVNWRSSRNRNRYADYVICDRDPVTATFYDEVWLKSVLSDAASEGIHGEWMGFLKLSAKGATICRTIIEQWLQRPESLAGVDIRGLLNRIVEEGHRIQVLSTAGNWIDCDSALDAIDGSEFT
ncbi:MAG: Phosphonopyruvate hydrolase [Verrucomicrobia subdivision 3 bacterium]|nr:Phosphonopyruvate hydrolase [Limisphaerales bacterium]MCS1416148.1 Phosphonopyruvate hydrolase [Limisphaerales bacterium]